MIVKKPMPSGFCPHHFDTKLIVRARRENNNSLELTKSTLSFRRKPVYYTLGFFVHTHTHTCFIQVTHAQMFTTQVHYTHTGSTTHSGSLHIQVIVMKATKLYKKTSSLICNCCCVVVAFNGSFQVFSWNCQTI